MKYAASMTPDAMPRAIPSTGSGALPGGQPRDEPDRDDDDGRREHPDRGRPQRIAGGLEPDVPGDVQDAR